MHDPSAGVTKERKLQVEVGMLKLLVKKNKVLGWNHFPSIKKWVTTPFRQTSISDKWDLCEGYGGPKLSKKKF